MTRLLACLAACALVLAAPSAQGRTKPTCQDRCEGKVQQCLDGCLKSAGAKFLPQCKRGCEETIKECKKQCGKKNDKKR